MGGANAVLASLGAQASPLALSGILPRTAGETPALPGILRASMAVTFDLIRELALKLPGVEEGTSYGTAALRVKGKFMARLKEDGESVVFRVSFDERELLMQTKPDVFYITDHYLGYPA